MADQILQNFLKYAAMHREHYILNIFGTEHSRLALNTLILDCMINKRNMNFRVGIDKEQEFVVSIDESFNDVVNVIYTSNTNDLLTVFHDETINNSKIFIHEHFRRFGKEGIKERDFGNFIRVIRPRPFTGLMVLTNDISFMGLADLYLAFRIHDNTDAIIYLPVHREEGMDYNIEGSISFKEFDKNPLLKEIEDRLVEYGNQENKENQ